MHGGQNTAAALEAVAADIGTVGADTATVDAEFWALVWADDEWLAAEFGAIVSEPCETRVRIAFRPNRIDAAPPEGSGPALPGATSSSVTGWRTGGLPGRRWRRERSPPLGAMRRVLH